MFGRAAGRRLELSKGEQAMLMIKRLNNGILDFSQLVESNDIIHDSEIAATEQPS
jgi:hypothetical protein